MAVKYLKRLMPLMTPYGLPSSPTTGAMPPVLLARVQAAPSWNQDGWYQRRRMTDSNRGDASVS
ncbi:hypothetical protein, partial [Candidatus Villigracilis saccharophilus]|uniref:hypothetical protein n=1 Tax=Candidatus Villigracilis saccharophilus TaxID=3140684 RepID=UPI0031358A2E|nr:hypothetical protein [Anaerolineales bacterium]